MSTGWQSRDGVSWVAFGLGALPFALNMFETASTMAETSVWPVVGLTALMLNFWMPVVAGIALADRLPRDRTLAVHELIAATSLTRTGYVVGNRAMGCLGGSPSASAPSSAFALLNGLLVLFETALQPWPKRRCNLARGCRADGADLLFQAKGPCATN
jgi:hypothetical protein